MRDRIDVGVLGATGIVGQHLVSRLADHPWFRLAWVAASHRSAGRRYGELPWRLAAPRPIQARDLIVRRIDPSDAPPLVFSALDAAVAGEAETAFARAGRLVVSNARNHRLDPLVPLLIPEVNADHLALLDAQRQTYGWSGGLITNPNCSTVILTMALAALRRFGLRRVVVTTLQALSGAGHPGVPALDAVGNVIPYISGEEEKIETETRKLLGTLAGGRIADAPLAISAQATRVPVADGHTVAVAVELEQAASTQDVRDAFSSWHGAPQQLALPSAPARPLVYLDDHDRPQPRLDVWEAGGMAVTVGRLRRCPVLTWKFVALGHNVVRGAAGAALLNAELAVASAAPANVPLTIGTHSMKS
ncbi:MAG TPA: aspartate-semialdehyde dehydrogenase [Vicinamibacterales bacterium]|nr:aspartate-semialdehyde dehydrogenase [Vicinamibacterales bacterium]